MFAVGGNGCSPTILDIGANPGPAISLWWLVYNRDDRLLGVVIVEADGPAARVLPGFAHSTSAG
jgi:hypothetical protein